MLTSDEQRFITYWENNRLKQKSFIRQLMIGLPAGVIFVFAIFANLLSGWYKRAEMILNTYSSLILVLLTSAIIIVLFISIFSVRHRWEMNEQRYKELIAKRDKL